jgi:hypothetical protein
MAHGRHADVRGGGFPSSVPRRILGHAGEGTTLAIYTHSMRRTRDDLADKIAALAGLSDLRNKVDTNGSAGPEEAGLSDCFNGSTG